MAFKTVDGKQKFGNRMKANRYDRAHEGEKPSSMKDGGPRAQAHEVEAQKPMGEEQAEESVHPGIHEEIKGIAAEHGPAHSIQMSHDDEAGRHEVHSMHPDGHEHRAMHTSRMHAHHHAMHAAGVSPEEEEENKQGEYPEEHKSATTGDEDDYETPEL